MSSSSVLAAVQQALSLSLILISMSLWSFLLQPFHIHSISRRKHCWLRRVLPIHLWADSQGNCFMQNVLTNWLNPYIYHLNNLSLKTQFNREAEYLEATATEIDTIERTVKVLTVLCDDEDSCNLEEEFPINYDYLLTIFEAKTTRLVFLGFQLPVKCLCNKEST